MYLRTEIIFEKRLIGNRVKTSFSDDKTRKLWQNFMPRRKDILNRLSADLISLQIYYESFGICEFNPTIEFEKWALTEVSDFTEVPKNMESFILTEGLYAVFLHKNAINTAEDTFKYIFKIWIPNSEYHLDNKRPHFEVLGEQYKNNDITSEEEIWIPIKLKHNH